MNQDERLGDIVDTYRKHFWHTAETVFDIGTRDGDDAKYLSDRLGAGYVLAVDANPVAVQATLRAHPSFTVVECAVSNFDGEGTFTRIVSDRKDFAGSSSLIKHQDFGEPVETFTVRVARMDTLIDELGLSGKLFDVVKVDVEGFTFECVQGFGDYVSRVKMFHLETETFERHPGHHNSVEVKELMTQLGFELVSVSYEWGPQIEDQLWVNTSFINRKMY
jgi:FkbM family methyltransferase